MHQYLRFYVVLFFLLFFYIFYFAFKNHCDIIMKLENIKKDKEIVETGINDFEQRNQYQ